MLLKVAKVKKLLGYLCVIFEKPKDFHFYAGQYLDYELPVKDPDGNGRSFTISSSPTENFLILSTRYGISPFKKKLITIKPGDRIKTSHPAGTFTLDEKSPAVMIAGGIGITPFRSMIKWALDQKLTTSITLIYLNSDDNFLFKKELNKWQKQLPNLTIIYHNSSQKGHLNLDSKFLILDSIYYLAGPPKMVDSFEKILLDLGVEKENIRYDHFDGYL